MTTIGSDAGSQRVFISTTPTVDQCWVPEPELMKHSPEAMRCFRAHYQPENMTVVIVGGSLKACLRTGAGLSSSSRSGVIVVLRRKWWENQCWLEFVAKIIACQG